jgi:transposase
VDETTYLTDSIKHWLWVAASDQACLLLLALTRSAAELQQFLGPNFAGILSSNCFSVYNPQTATAKQKCLTHLERDLRALETSQLAANRDFSSQVSAILNLARQTHRDYHSDQLSWEQLQASNSNLNCKRFCPIHRPRDSPADIERLRQQLHKY